MPAYNETREMADFSSRHTNRGTMPFMRCNEPGCCQPLSRLDQLQRLEQPVALVVAAWQRLQRCTDEFDRPEDCAEWQDAFETAVERLAAL